MFVPSFIKFGQQVLFNLCLSHSTDPLMKKRVQNCNAVQGTHIFEMNSFDASITDTDVVSKQIKIYYIYKSS
jgi:hypothetical protein